MNAPSLSEPTSFSAKGGAEYPYGFSSTIETDRFEPGLDELKILALAEKKGEPKWMVDFRLKAYERWLKSEEPHWANVRYPPIDYQAIRYYSAPKKKATLGNLKDADPELLRTFKKLGIPLDEQLRLANVAVDLVFDSVSIGTTFQQQLQDSGVILCSMSEAIERYPDLVQRYLGSVVPIGDNFFATLNSAVFTDGSFVYVPENVHCPVDLSTYFRINDRESGQFERTLIIAEKGSSVSYLEGCTAPSYDQNQLHAAVVELIALDDAVINYSTVQNWYAGDKESGKGGIYNFVTKRGCCRGRRSKISWTQVEVGAAITWKYPSCILMGEESVGEFYSVALTNGKMQADTGTKMIHLGKGTRSTIVSKGISADESVNNYRGIVKIAPKAENSRNYTQCDSMLVGNRCSANTFPTIEVASHSAKTEHEATTTKMDLEIISYLLARGFDEETAISIIVGAFCDKVIRKLPLEFAQEAEKLLTLKLEHSVG